MYEVSQSCPTLCDPVDGSLPGSPSIGFSRQEYWSGLPFPPPGDLPDPGIEPASSALQADTLPSELAVNPLVIYIRNYFTIFLAVVNANRFHYIL